MSDTNENTFFISKQTILSTHPDFNSATISLPYCQCYGMYKNSTVTDVAEMLLQVGTLILMKEYPKADELTLKELHDKLPSDYKPLNNCQKPNVTMVDPVSYYLQAHRYPGEFKTAAEVNKAINAIMYMAGEYIKKIKTVHTIRDVQNLFISELLVNKDDS